MFKGLGLSYTVLLLTFSSVAASGYWAFGNVALTVSYLITSTIKMAMFWCINGFGFLSPQSASLSSGVYLHQLYSGADVCLSSVNLFSPQCDIKNNLKVHFCDCSHYHSQVASIFWPCQCTDGASGLVPLDFILPVIFFNLTFEPSKRCCMFLVIGSVFSLIMVIGVFAATRQIVLNSNAVHSFDHPSDSLRLPLVANSVHGNQYQVIRLKKHNPFFNMPIP
ncbi:GABA transporter 1-like [Chenopodium quinoa]|uniref:GABA transporter 1-like n=1 Tax=Chenopodium quinoa TaxID=63459 RepID=UPI000B774EC6|nr:GABA transporter 1-like [Chenopodium quinoa]